MSELRRDLRVILADGVMHSVMVGLGETYLPAFALALGMGGVWAGLVATVPLLAGGLVQLASPRGVARVGSYRRWTVTWAVIQALSFGPLVAAALGAPLPAWIVFITASTYWAAGQSVTTAWNAWVGRLVPVRVRGRYFGWRQSWMQAAVMGGVIAGGLALHHSRGGVHHLQAFAAIFLVAGLCRLASAMLLSRQGLATPATPRARPRRMATVAARLRGSERRRLLAYILSAVAAANLGGAYLTPFMFRHLEVSYAQYMMLLGGVFVAKIACLPWIGDLIKKFGARPVLTAGAIGIAPLPLLWGAGNFWLLLGVQVFAGVAWACFELAMFMTLFGVEDEDERVTLLAGFNALHAAAVAGASIVGGLLLWSLGGDRDAYLIVFVASAALRVIALMVLVRRLPRLPIPSVMPALRILAVRPWGGAVVKPIVATLDRLRPGRPRLVPSARFDTSDLADEQVAADPVAATLDTLPPRRRADSRAA